MGPLGSASIVKVITNLLALGHLIMAGEAFMLGNQAGIDPKALLEVFRPVPATAIPSKRNTPGLQRKL